MTGPAAQCKAPASRARPSENVGGDGTGVTRGEGIPADELCSCREFARRMNAFTDASPHARWHPEGSARRIHSTLQEACRHLRRGDTEVDLGCLPPSIVYGFHVAGLLPRLDCAGTCIEGPGDTAFDGARALGVRLERVDLDPRFALYDGPAGLPARLPILPWCREESFFSTARRAGARSTPSRTEAPACT